MKGCPTYAKIRSGRGCTCFRNPCRGVGAACCRCQRQADHQDQGGPEGRTSPSRRSPRRYSSITGIDQVTTSSSSRISVPPSFRPWRKPRQRSWKCWSCASCGIIARRWCAGLPSARLTRMRIAVTSAAQTMLSRRAPIAVSLQKPDELVSPKKASCTWRLPKNLDAARFTIDCLGAAAACRDAWRLFHFGNLQSFAERPGSAISRHQSPDSPNSYAKR